MNRQILGIAIPILTFLLGCAFTLYMKRVDERRQAGRTSAGELWKLVKEWYEQLRQLQIDLLNSPNLRHVHERLGTYLGNRLILPGVLYHLEILKKQKQHRELVAEVEQFLQMVTDYDPVDVYRQTNCRLLMELLDFLPGDAEGDPARRGGPKIVAGPPLRNLKALNPSADVSGKLFDDLDASVQSISRLAAAPRRSWVRRSRRLTSDRSRRRDTYAGAARLIRDVRQTTPATDVPQEP